jgi:hypothetical protein
MKVEDRLSTAGTDVDHDAVVLEAGLARGVGDELEHAARLVWRELADVAEGVDVPLRQHEQVHGGLRVDVADGDEPFRAADVVALANEPAEEAVVTQRARPPR